MDKAKQIIRVHLGNHLDTHFSEMISECIKMVLDGKYQLELKESFYGHQLIESAERKQIDIGIVVMNNLMVGTANNSIDERMANSLQVITALKKNYRIPVIAMSGWLDDSLIIKKVKREADFFFERPFKLEDFMAAFRICLDRFIGHATVQIPFRIISFELHPVIFYKVFIDRIG